MRRAFYGVAGAALFTLVGLVIGIPLNHQLMSLLIPTGILIGLIASQLRREIRERSRRHVSAEFELCDPCWRGEHSSGIPCPNLNVLHRDCACARCSPFIGRYTPDESPSRFNNIGDDRV